MYLTAMIMGKLTTILSNNPKVGLISSAGGFVIGWIPNVILMSRMIVIEWLQIVAFSLSILVALMTIVSMALKFRYQSKKKKRAKRINQSYKVRDDLDTDNL